MNAPRQPDRLEAMILGHLDAEAATVEANAMWHRVKPALATAWPRQKRSWAKPLLLGSLAALAACLLIGLFLTGQTTIGERTMSAEEVIREAREKIESEPVDRCYEVKADWDLRLFQNRFRFTPATKTAKVWTRGDQFIVTMQVESGQPWTWGQDKTGQVWLAPNRRHIIAFDKDELNEPIERFCDLMSLRLVDMLAELLDGYELAKDVRPDAIVIDAKIPPSKLAGRPLRRVTLELDPATKVVTRAVLYRAGSEDRVEFTLTATGKLGDGFYKPQGHTDDGAIVHDGKPRPQTTPPRPKLRDELLKRLQQQRPKP